MSTYIRDISIMSKSTANEYLSRLNDFKDFMVNEYDSHLSIDDLTTKIKQGDEDPYDILNRYAAYLKNCNIGL
jgi:hypothetical protein